MTARSINPYTVSPAALLTPKEETPLSAAPPALQIEIEMGVQAPGRRRSPREG